MHHFGTSEICKQLSKFVSMQTSKNEVQYKPRCAIQTRSILQQTGSLAP